MAPGSGCQLNSGRVSEMASPKGPSRANLVLAPGAPEWGSSATRVSRGCVLAAASEGGAARLGAAAGAGGAVRAAGAADAPDPADAAKVVGAADPADATGG